MKNTSMFTRFASMSLLAVAPLAFAQDQPAAASAPAAPAAPASVWSVGPIDFSGLIDGYYTGNFNHPQSSPGTPGENTLYNFNYNANQMSLGMAKLTMQHDADPVGFRVDLGFGKAFDRIHASEPSGQAGFMRNVEQALFADDAVAVHHQPRFAFTNRKFLYRSLVEFNRHRPIGQDSARF